MLHLLSQLSELGIKIHLKGDQLQVNVPAGTLTPELRAALQANKQELIARLRKQGGTEAETVWPKVEPDAAGAGEDFPMTDVQYAYWMGRNSALELGRVSTHFYFELDCGPVDLPRLESAWRRLVDRHGMLRAVFGLDGRQRILPAVPAYVIEVTDLGAVEPVARDAAYLGIRDAMSHQVIPSDRWPLFEIRASKSAEGSYRLHVSLDLLILDGWSISLLFKEWRQLYEQPAAVLPEIPISFRDYVLTEAKMRDGAWYRAAHDYWWNRLDTLPPAPQLPINKVEAGRQYRFTRRKSRLPAHAWGAIKERAKAIGVTPSGILVSAFSEVLALWSRKPAFTLNLTLFNRWPLHESVNALVGDFTSLTLLEVDCAQDSSFRERAVRVQERFLRDLEYRVVSGVEVMREFSKRRGYAMQAAMPVVFTSGVAFGSPDGGEAGFVESLGPMVYGVSQTPQVWLDHQVMEDRGELVMFWDCAEEVFPPGVLDDMFSVYIGLLENLAGNKETWEMRNPVALPREQAARRLEVNATEAWEPEGLLHQGFLDMALSRPDAVAVICQDRHITYGELLGAAVRLSGRLSGKDVKDGNGAEGRLIAVVMEKGWEQIAAVFGILLAGGAYLPIDPDLPEERRRQLFQESGAELAVIQPILETLLAWPEGVERIGIGEADLVPHSGPIPESTRAPGDLAYVIFTSGSTGTPKGVAIDHRGALNTVKHINALFRVTDQDRVLAVSSLSFDLSVYDIFGLLAAGGAIVVPDAKLSREPEHWHDLLLKNGVTLWNSAPPLMRMLMDFSESAGRGGKLPMRLVMLSGDWIPTDLPDRIRALGNDPEIISLGGATEVSIWSIYYPIGQVGADWKSIPYGKPLPNQTIHVLNERLQPCPEGVAGRIYIGGIGLAIGYWRDEAKTAQKFITDGVTGLRLYDTGDLGRWLPDGNVEFLGREDSQVKIRGHRVELGEIASILRGHPAVQDAVVIAEGDGRTEQSLWAYLKLREESRDSAMLRLECPPEASEAAWRELLRTLRLDALENPAAPVGEGFRSMCAELDLLYLESVQAAFLGLGVFRAAETLSAEELRVRAGIVVRYRRWVDRALAALAGKGLLERLEDGSYRAAAGLPVRDMQPILKSVETKLMDSVGFTQGQARWFTRIAECLPDLLTEKMHSAEVYTSEETPRIYQKMFPDGHVQLRRAVQSILGDRGDRPFRILEVGAGLGSATTHVLPLLRSVECAYHFTDISEFFFRQAKERFADFGFVSYQLFNADEDPFLQGYDSHSYDLILAASVLHDVVDLRATLTNLRGLLAPGGFMLLLEETKMHPSFDLHMGLQQGFDSFGDPALRQGHPLLSRDRWIGLLSECGYRASAGLTEPGTVADFIGFDVLAAQGPDRAELLDEAGLNRHLLKRLPAFAEPGRYLVMRDFPVSSNGKLDYKAFPRPKRRARSLKDKVRPRNAVEASLQILWAEVLGDANVGVTENFFEIGGDSLIAAQLMRKVFEQFGTQIPLYDLFGSPTIEGLAAVLASQLSASFAPGEAGDGALPPLDSVFPALRMDTARLAAEVKLPAAVAALPGRSSRADARAEGSFLTGATGFLGAYVLRDLLREPAGKAHCLVKADSEEHGLQRIRENLKRYGVWEDRFQERIVAVPGDISRPDLGMSAGEKAEVSSRVGTIYHLAGEVNLVRAYEDLRPAYVDAIQGILEFAAMGRVKPILFSSSIATSMRYLDGKGMVINREEAPSATPEGLPVGYAQCKWVVEQTLALADRAGIPSAVFRPSHILADSETGASSGWDMFSGLVYLCTSVGVLPEWDDAVVDGVPVDAVSRIILQAGKTPSAFGKVFNLAHDRPIPMHGLLRTLLGLAQSSLEPCGREEWKRACVRFLETDAPVELRAVLLRFFTPTAGGEMIDYFFRDHGFHTANAKSIMDAAGQKWPALDPAYWQRYWQKQNWTLPSVEAQREKSSVA